MAFGGNMTAIVIPMGLLIVAVILNIVVVEMRFRDLDHRIKRQERR